MEKEQKHQKAQALRHQLETYCGRVELILALASKETFNEVDILAVKMLTRKKYSDCKPYYPRLVLKLQQRGMQNEADAIQQVWASC